MKKNIGLFLMAVLLLSTLTSCGALKVDENTVYVQKKGKIIGASVESFDKEYYSEEELEEYVNQRVEDYAESHGKKIVKMDRFSVEDGVARLNIKYAGYEDYAEFNGVELFAGTVVQAMAAGYDFEDEFLTVTDGKLGESADKDTVTADDSYKVVILNEKVNVKVDGTVLYVSAKYTSMAGEDTVAIALPEDAVDGEELALTYIIYK